MSLKKICEIDLPAPAPAYGSGLIEAPPGRAASYRLARADDGVGYALTQGAGEDPYGTPYHVVVRVDQVRDMAPELLQLLGATMEELLDLKAKLAVRSGRAES